MEKTMRDKRQETRDKGQGTKRLLFALLVAGFLLLVAPSAEAASLYFSPSSGSYTVGSAFSVSVYISSAEQAMNAAFGIISFPQDKLEATSLSKSGSIFSLWVQEPSFSNAAGTINFEGIVLNPGFTGATGKVISINFRAKAAGVATLNFSSGSVLANDGKGTNILAGLGNAQFSLGGAASTAPTVPESTTPSAVSGAPSAPQISSPTHPDPNEWYAQKDAKFIWTIPSGVTGVRLLVGKIPAAIPTVIYTPAINEKEVANLDDGIWYFHVQLRNANGWGEISHFRFQIDIKPPEPFSIKFIDGKETDNPQPTVIFDTTDALSGINYYKIKIGEGDFFNVSEAEVKNNPYTLPLQSPGKRTILVQAFDIAGNYSTAVEEFIIKPINPPIITDYPQKLQSREILTVKGKSYPDGQVIIWLQKDREEAKGQSVKSGKDGNFVFISDEKMEDGVYKLWAEAIDSRGARSVPTEKFTITVEPAKLFQIGSWTINLLAVLVPIISLIIVLLLIILYGWHKSSLFKRRARKEIHEAESILHKAFNLLKEDIQDQIKLLERTKTKRQLTEEEEKIMSQLKKDLEKAEKTIRKEIEDIEKEIK